MKLSEAILNGCIGTTQNFDGGYFKKEKTIPNYDYTCCCVLGSVLLAITNKNESKIKSFILNNESFVPFINQSLDIDYHKINCIYQVNYIDDIITSNDILKLTREEIATRLISIGY